MPLGVVSETRAPLLDLELDGIRDEFFAKQQPVSVLDEHLVAAGPQNEPLVEIIQRAVVVVESPVGAAATDDDLDRLETVPVRRKIAAQLLSSLSHRLSGNSLP